MPLYSPFVYWGQDDSHLSLRVDLKSALSPRIDLKATELTFTARGIGAQGTNDYSFHFSFFSQVVPKVRPLLLPI